LPEGTIEATEVWKRFRADARGTNYLQDEVRRLVGRMKGDSGRGWRWVLRDVSFEVEQGSSVAVVGANGSGKSTLLKILTQVMYPTAGRVRLDGRVGALIELRGGLHDNLTGRENIFLTGSMMGLPRRVVAERLDEIVAFAELERAIDRQLKYYSVGMQMRLGFGVAAFLEPHVLLVDEVLAVGDAAFQQRCLDHLRYRLSQGTTLVFVSHDLAAVEATCRDGLWLHDGEIRARGGIRDVLTDYRHWVEEGAQTEHRATGVLRVGAQVSAGSGPVIQTNETLDVLLTVEADDETDVWLSIGVSEGTASPVFVVSKRARVVPGPNRVRCSIAHLPLPRGRYSIWLAGYEPGTFGRELVPWQPLARFEVHGPVLDVAPQAVVRLAPVHVDAVWSVEQGSLP
jgi:ABC-type polysaccharide/polyol phosphate transport system ATPase subunit